jgi:hypothetical protein
MNKISTKTKVTKVETTTVNYNNGVICEFTKKNGKLSHYQFSSKKIRLYPITNEGKDFLRQNHWSEHYRVFKEFPYKITIKEILNFTDFESLTYIGGGYDGKLKDYQGNPLSSVINMGEVFFQIYEKIETTKKECEDILNNLKGEYIIHSKIIEIPYYNQNEEMDDHYTLSLQVLLPQDIFEQLYDNDTDTFKKVVFKFLKNEL